MSDDLRQDAYKKGPLSVLERSRGKKDGCFVCVCSVKTTNPKEKKSGLNGWICAMGVHSNNGYPFLDSGTCPVGEFRKRV